MARKRGMTISLTVIMSVLIVLTMGSQGFALNSELDIMESQFNKFGIRKTPQIHYAQMQKSQLQSNSWITLPMQENIMLNKEWTIGFNQMFSVADIGAIVIEKDDEFIPVKINLKPDEKKAIISPMYEYVPDSQYSLRVFLNNGNQYRMNFSTVAANDGDIETPELPAKYDLRQIDRVTDVKNQGNTNSCWAFASISALETAHGNDDGLVMDAFHLYNNTGYDNIDGIGQYLTAVPYFAAWKGPVLENTSNDLSVKQVQEILYIKPGDLKCIKDMIINYGAVASTIGMSSEDRYWNSTTKALYKDDCDQVNHAITLVGWDDNYSKNNFSVKPPEDGAFIVKNSWGESWGDHGYFYVSYYDKSLGYGNDGNITNIVFSKVKDAGYFDNNYQYDELGNTATWGSNETEMFANVFEINQGNEEKLKAISFYTLDENTSYEASIVYDFKNSSSFDSMEKIAEGSFEYAGYHTVELDDEIELEKDTNIAVVVKVTTPYNSSPVAVEIPNGIYNSTSKARSNMGESYVKINGEWMDFYSISNNGNVCLKIFTNNSYDLPLQGLGISHEEVTIHIGERQQIIPIFTPQNASDKNVVWFSENEDIANVDSKGIIKGLQKGETYISVKTVDGRFESKCKVIVNDMSSNEHLIADSNLEDIIRAEINKTSGELTEYDLKGISYLNIYSANIVSLEGLQHLTNLENIYISENSIKDLSPLSKIANLKDVSIYDNPVSDITALESLVNLKKLTIENANVSNIDSISELKELEHLCFYGNEIEDIKAVAKLSKLKTLDLVGNRITDIKPVEKLTNLEKMYISANQISDISPLKDLVKLKALVLGGNNITDYSPVKLYYNNLVNKDFEL